MAALALAACGGTEAQSTATPEPSDPVGIVAIGHSGLTGEGTAGPLQAAPENSWATGTNPTVNSVYLRMVEARPETEGHVANTAVGGALAAELRGQAEQALQQVAAPALVIISTIDNDIRCDGSDGEHVREFGEDVRAALDTITSRSPDSRILVVGQFGRPDPSFVQALVAHDPAVKPDLTGSGICDFFDPTGRLSMSSFEELTAIINAYEAEEARICAEYPRCHTDGGVRAAYKDKLENFAPDWAHLNVAGQAEQAEIMWPVVEEVLSH